MPVAITAIARELVGLIRVIAHTVEPVVTGSNSYETDKVRHTQIQQAGRRGRSGTPREPKERSQ